LNRPRINPESTQDFWGTSGDPPPGIPPVDPSVGPPGGPPTGTGTIAARCDRRSCGRAVASWKHQEMISLIADKPANQIELSDQQPVVGVKAPGVSGESPGGSPRGTSGRFPGGVPRGDLPLAVPGGCFGFVLGLICCRLGLDLGWIWNQFSAFLKPHLLKPFLLAL
jgi:hypothetical protein